jgi:hypothetical protein
VDGAWNGTQAETWSDVPYFQAEAWLEQTEAWMITLRVLKR